MIKLKKPKSLSVKLVLMLAVILIVLNLIVTGCMTILIGIGMNNKQDAFLEQTTADAQKQVAQFIDKYEAVAEILAGSSQVQEIVNQADAARPISASEELGDVTATLKAVMSSCTDILGIGYGSVAENYIYTQEGKRLDVKLTERPYYSMASQETYVTQPYVDTATGEMCVSIAAPVRAGKNTTGLLVIDLKLTQISEFLKEMAFGNSGRIILLAEDNTIMGGQNAEQLGRNLEDIGVSGKIFKELESPSGEIVKYDLNGESRTGMVSRLPEGWKVLSAMSTSEYNAQTIRTTLYLILFLTIHTIVTAVLLCMIIVKKLRPISELNDGLRKISEGNLSAAILYKGDDELGEMADSMRSCIESLSSYVGEISAIMGRLAEGDLTVKSRVEFKGEFIPIQNSMFHFVDQLTEMMISISQASEQVSSGSEQVSSGAQALAQGATEQASSIEELAATITELSAAINTNSKMAQEASTNAEQVNGEIVESSEKMKHSLDMMEEIRSSAGKVGGIVKTIEDIAFQTNILALNAAVEAARAGQAGKGFAVVADEVRNLAAKSAEASKATTDLIGGMLTAIENGGESMRQTKQYMDNVVTEAAEITEVFRKISEASMQQFVSVSQVTLGTDQISSVVQTNSATAEESAAASEELSGQADMLKFLIAKFRLPGQE